MYYLEVTQTGHTGWYKIKKFDRIKSAIQACETYIKKYRRQGAWYKSRVITEINGKIERVYPIKNVK